MLWCFFILFFHFFCCFLDCFVGKQEWGKKKLWFRENTAGISHNSLNAYIDWTIPFDYSMNINFVSNFFNCLHINKYSFVFCTLFTFICSIGENYETTASQISLQFHYYIFGTVSLCSFRFSFLKKIWNTREICKIGHREYFSFFSN